MIPFAAASSTLVAGCGGGFDVVCALPVAFSLKKAGHSVHLASYTFSEIKEVTGAERIDDKLFRVDRHCQPPASGYCPEVWLCRWWHQHFGEDISVWCYRRVGVRPLAERFDYLRQKLDLQAIVVVDAGVDGLFWGDEFELGTPETDTSSLLAAYLQDGLPRYCAFTAFGTEGTNYEVRHSDALQRMSELIAQGACLGVSALLPQSHEGALLHACVTYIHEQMGSEWNSHMAGSLVAAMEGRFGEQRLTHRCEVHPIWVSPLTLLYWFFDLPAVAEARPYLAQALQTDSVGQLHELIQGYRQSQPVTPRRDIPI